MRIIAQLTGVQQADARIRAMMVEAKGAIPKVIKTEALHLVAYIKQNKLTDQVLRVRTGRLRRSITAQFRQDGQSFQAMVGTNVRYARAHEYGFNGSVNVPSHKVKSFQRMQSMAFGKPMKNPRMITVKEHVVKDHAMKMNIAPRPFIRPAAEENQERMTTNLRAALAGALK